MYIYIYICTMYVCLYICKYAHTYEYCGPGSSVGTATELRLDGPVSNPSRDEIFRPSRPALGPTKPPVQWVLCLSQE